MKCVFLETSRKGSRRLGTETGQKTPGGERRHTIGPTIRSGLAIKLQLIIEALIALAGSRYPLRNGFSLQSCRI